ncbi:MAG: beta-galactosidase [Candidatus Omnitrophica bacterium]|nr:beta-galactosidase [Candidatus Omnitrophota bacterium]
MGRRFPECEGSRIRFCRSLEYLSCAAGPDKNCALARQDSAGNGSSGGSYASCDWQRFRRWLRKRYSCIENMESRYRQKIGSFDRVSPPRSPEEGFLLWNDWMEARADWCEDFAHRTCRVYRAVDANLEHHLVLSDFDYYLERNSLHHGVDYRRLMLYFDRFEIYMADDFRHVPTRALLGNVKRDVERGRTIAGKKPFQFHLWIADPVEFTPMRQGLVEQLAERATELGADVLEFYTYKVHDWRSSEGSETLMDGRPVFDAISLKANPSMQRRIRRLITRLKLAKTGR